MGKGRTRPALARVEDWLTKKTAILSKAQAFAAMGLAETAQPLFATAASYEERIAPLLEANGDVLEAAVHRISAASCYKKAGDPSRAANLFQAALAGPLRDHTRKEVEALLAECLMQLAK